MAANRIDDASSADPWTYQWHILPDVSRTFALTIPQLPSPLDAAVTNAYLLCRIADTIEDDARLSATEKSDLHAELVAAIQGDGDSHAFAERAANAVAPTTPARERKLLATTPTILSVTHALSLVHQRVLKRCLNIMCYGMSYYQRNAGNGGMRSLGETDRYCYYVAGVVGEILTELFCLHSRDIAARRSELLELAPSFGEGLQLTNILKDFWDDYTRGVCWLPADLFAQHGVTLGQLDSRDTHIPGFADALHEMVAIAHGHLRNAFAYTLAIPKRHTGIRRFCLWALGLAVLTLRRIDRNPGYRSGSEVKVSRPALRGTIALSNLSARNDTLLRALFTGATARLPQRPTSLNTDEISCWHDHWPRQPVRPPTQQPPSPTPMASPNHKDEAVLTGVSHKG